METIKKRFEINVFATREEMGRVAAEEVAQKVLALLEHQEKVRMIFAAAPSQNEFLSAFVADKRIDFSRIVAFHMDEYVGLPEDAPQGFGNFLKDRLFDKAPFGKVYYLHGNAADIDAECARYAALLNEAPIDIVCMGIGENGHIAFNDPAVADLDDPKAVKQVELDDVCRMQQVHDGCFASIDCVPKTALTLTVSRLRNAASHFCIVPAKTKANAVYRCVMGPVTSECPATALRLCEDAKLYLDADSAANL